MEIKVSITGRVEANELVWYTYDPIVVFNEYKIYKDKKIVVRERGVWYDANKLEVEIKDKLEKIMGIVEI